MPVLEDLLEEVKELNKNLRTLSPKYTTLKKPIEVTTKEIKASKPKTEHQTEEKEFTKDYVLSIGKEFIKNADSSDKAAFKDKLSEFGTDKLSTLDAKHYAEIIDFMKARLDA